MGNLTRRVEQIHRLRKLMPPRKPGQTMARWGEDIAMAMADQIAIRLSRAIDIDRANKVLAAEIAKLVPRLLPEQQEAYVAYRQAFPDGLKIMAWNPELPRLKPDQLPELIRTLKEHGIKGPTHLIEDHDVLSDDDLVEYDDPQGR